MQAVIGTDLSVIANTADDCEVHGLVVSPDPDLCTYWLAGQIDEERGWGIKGDELHRPRATGRRSARPTGSAFPTATSLPASTARTSSPRAGRVTAAQAQIARGLGVAGAVLPMCEERVRTRVRTPAGWRGLQEFLILDEGEAPIEAIEVDGLADAQPHR